MVDSILAPKTDPAVLELIALAAKRKMSPAEMFDQRVSFVFGCMKLDGGMTRDFVRKTLARQQGVTLAA